MFETKTERRGAGFHVVSEATGHRSREEVIVEDGQDLLVGTVLGTITANGKSVQIDLLAGDGSETAAGVLWDDVKADGADEEGAAHVRDCEVLGAELVYPDGASSGDIDTINAQLLTLGIVVR